MNLNDLVVPGVRSLQPYQPGKPVEELERELGIEGIVKLASNENPRSPAATVQRAMAAAASEISRYPDGSGFQLKQRLSKVLKVTPSNITLGNGSNDVLELIVRAFVQSGEGVVVSAHAFAVYVLSASAAGAKLQETPARNWGHDLDAMFDMIDGETRAVFIANPNNPTGTWVTSTKLRQFLNALPSHVIAVVDEAYFEYVEEAEYPNCIEMLPGYPNLIVTRTFSKIYGLAGLRVGYAIASEQITEVMNRIRHPFNVNSIALAAAAGALDDREFVESSRTLNREQMTVLCEGFTRLGLDWIPSVGNFVTVDVGQPAMDVFNKMLLQGVIVRPVANYGMPNHLRFTVGLSFENEKALHALEQALSK
jgi:histidinol-phosphate aminotransferase